MAPDEVVRALQSLELGVDGDDGLIRNEFTLTKEDSFSAYQAYKVLTQPTPDSSGAKVKGALIGGAIIGAGLGIAAFGGASVLPGLLLTGLTGAWPFALSLPPLGFYYVFSVANIVCLLCLESPMNHGALR